MENFETKLVNEMTEDGFKKLFPEAAGAPLISPNLEGGNAGARLLSNDESITEMLKGLNFNDEKQAAACAFALGENEIFLYNKDGKVNLEVERIRTRIKYRATSQCSVKGLWVDQYKQAATGVLTSTASARGYVPLNMPAFPKRYEDSPNGNNKQFANNKKP